MNLVSLALQFLGPAILGKFAGAMGVNSTLAQKAVMAAIPAILSGILGKSAQPGGAQILSDLLGKQDGGMLGKLGDMIGGPQQKTIVDQGSSALGSLLGNSAMGSLAGALAKYAGLGDGPAKSLIGMLAPVVLGQLGQQQKSAGLDASGLAKMLMGQKENISAAMPGDFAKLLGGSGLLDAIGGAAPAAPAKPAPSLMSSSTSSAAKPAAQASSGSWMPWLLAVAAAGVLWYSIFGGQRPNIVAMPPAQKIMVGNADVGGQMAGMFDVVRTSLANVKDLDTAKAALPRLQDAASQVSKISGLAAQMSPEAKRAVAGYLGQSLPTINPLIETILKIPGVSALLKPVLDQIMGPLGTLSKV
jgi:Bacterial protein of unknown function (DUF937)